MKSGIIYWSWSVFHYITLYLSILHLHIMWYMHAYVMYVLIKHFQIPPNGQIPQNYEHKCFVIVYKLWISRALHWHSVRRTWSAGVDPSWPTNHLKTLYHSQILTDLKELPTIFSYFSQDDWRVASPGGLLSLLIWNSCFPLRELLFTFLVYLC